MKINILFAKSFFERMVKPLGYIAFILFLFLNIASSQSTSFLYANVINGKKQAVISFLKNVQLLPEFNQFLIPYKKIYPDIEAEVFSEIIQRKKTIAELETVLEKNPDARDVLYNLSVLYKQNGDEKKSHEYMEKSKTIDPAIN